MGIAPTYAFVGEPEANGVIERLPRTAKEQTFYGRVFKSIEEVRDAVREFVACFNAKWLIKKNGTSARSTPAPSGSTRARSKPHNVLARSRSRGQ